MSSVRDLFYGLFLRALRSKWYRKFALFTAVIAHACFTIPAEARRQSGHTSRLLQRIALTRSTQVQCPEALFDQVVERDKQKGAFGLANDLEYLGKDYNQGSTAHEKCQNPEGDPQITSALELEHVIQGMDELDLGTAVQPGHIHSCLAHRKDGVSEEDKRATVANYYYLSNRLKMGSKANMEGVAGIDRLLGGDFMKGYPSHYNSRIPGTGDLAAQLKSDPACKERAPNDELQKMAEQTQHALKALVDLRKRQKQNRKRIGRANGKIVAVNKELDEKLTKSIAAITSAFPWLTSPAFEDIVHGPHPIEHKAHRRNGGSKGVENKQIHLWTTENIQSHLVQHLKDSRAAMIAQTKSYQQAAECIHSNKHGCLNDHVDSIAASPEIDFSHFSDLTTQKLKVNSITPEKADKLSSAYMELSMGVCRQEYRNSKEKTAEVVESTVFNVALTAATFGASAYAMAAIKAAQAAAAAGGKSLNIYQASSKVPNVAKVAFASALGADVHWVGPSARDALEQCAGEVAMNADRKGGSVEYQDDGMAKLIEPAAPQDFNKINCSTDAGRDLAIARESRNCILSVSLAAVDALPLLPPLAHSFASLRKTNSALEEISEKGKESIQAIGSRPAELSEIEIDNNAVDLGQQVHSSESEVTEAAKLRRGFNQQGATKADLEQAGAWGSTSAPESAQARDSSLNTAPSATKKTLSEEDQAKALEAAQRPNADVRNTLSRVGMTEAQIQSLAADGKIILPEQRLQELVQEYASVRGTPRIHKEILKDFGSSDFIETVPLEYRHELLQNLRAFLGNGGRFNTDTPLTVTGGFRWNFGDGGRPVISLNTERFSEYTRPELLGTLVHELEHAHRFERMARNLQRRSSDITIEEARRQVWNLVANDSGYRLLLEGTATQRQVDVSQLIDEPAGVFARRRTFFLRESGNLAAAPIPPNGEGPITQQIGFSLAEALESSDGAETIVLNNTQRRSIRDSIQRHAELGRSTQADSLRGEDVENWYEYSAILQLRNAGVPEETLDSLRNEMASSLTRQLAEVEAPSGNVRIILDARARDLAATRYSNDPDLIASGEARPSMLQHRHDEETVYRGSDSTSPETSQSAHGSNSSASQSFAQSETGPFPTPSTSLDTIFQSIPGAKDLNASKFTHLNSQERRELTSLLNEFQRRGGRISLSSNTNGSGRFNLDMGTDAPFIEINADLLQNPQALATTLRHELTHFSVNESMVNDLLRSNPSLSRGELRRRNLDSLTDSIESIRDFEAQAVGSEFTQLRRRNEELHNATTVLRRELSDDPGNINIVRQLEAAEIEEANWLRYSQNTVLYPENLSTRQTLVDAANRPTTAGSHFNTAERRRLETDLAQVRSTLQEDPLFQSAGAFEIARNPSSAPLGNNARMDLQFEELFLTPHANRLREQGVEAERIESILEELREIYHSTGRSALTP